MTTRLASLFGILIGFTLNIWLSWHIGKQYGIYVGWSAFLTMQTVDSIYRKVTA